MLFTAALTVGGTALPAHAVTVAFNFAGNFTFKVPAGVTSLTVAANGQPGLPGASAAGAGMSSGGLGASVTATVPVSPGTTYCIGVGLGGAHGGEAPNGLAGDGGGASSIRTCAGTNIVVGGGGGGGGGHGSALQAVTGGAGGAGGNASLVCPASVPQPFPGSSSAGSPGSASTVPGLGTPGGGGGGASCSGGGAGGAKGVLLGLAAGANNGNSGSFGSGGHGGTATEIGGGGGGGGGGGYFGGGGGGAGALLAGGGGGGAGTSFVNTALVVAASVTTGYSFVSSLTITYTAPLIAVAALAPANVEATPGVQSADVSWARPASSSDSPAVSSYIVTASPGGQSSVLSCEACGDVMSTTVAGLTPGVAYTFTVTSITGNGATTTSLPSNPVVPS